MRAISKTDSNYAADAKDQKSVSGHLHTLGGMITNWSSRKQKTTTLSSTEAEYVSMAECTQEVMFTMQLLRELTGVTIAGIVYRDNVGLLFLVENKQVGQRTKHIDVRYHFIRQKKEEGMLHTLFCRSEDNRSDVMTKNVKVNLFQNHLPSIRSIEED